MAVNTWGMLQKSAADSETIEEAITRLINAHRADETAHLETGESLQSHKASEIIDHLAESIVEDKIGDGEVAIRKLTSNHRVIISAFESLDGWSTDGGVAAELGSVTCDTTNVSGNHAGLEDVPSAISGLLWNKDFFWQTTIKLAQTTNQTIYFGIGGNPTWGGLSGAGFKIVNNTVYAYHWDYVDVVETYVTHEITGITLTNPNVYRMIYDYSAGTLAFYVDGVLEHTFSSGLPTDDSDELASYSIVTDENAKKYMYIFDLLISIPK